METKELDIVELYNKYFEFVKERHELELLGLINFKGAPIDEKHSLSMDFIKRSVNEFLKVNELPQIDPSVLAMIIVISNTITKEVIAVHNKMETTENL